MPRSPINQKSKAGNAAKARLHIQKRAGRVGAYSGVRPFSQLVSGPPSGARVRRCVPRYAPGTPSRRATKERLPKKICPRMYSREEERKMDALLLFMDLRRRGRPASEGVEAVMELCDVPRSTFYRWLAEYYKRGITSLRRKKGSGRKPVVSHLAINEFMKAQAKKVRYSFTLPQMSMWVQDKFDLGSVGLIHNILREYNWKVVRPGLMQLVLRIILLFRVISNFHHFQFECFRYFIFAIHIFHKQTIITILSLCL